MLYQPPLAISSGLIMTLYSAFVASQNYQKTLTLNPIQSREKIFTGVQEVPLYGEISLPPHPQGTIVATYGITGSLENQWFLDILKHKALGLGYAVVLFDWRAHGKSIPLSPTLTSDGIYEGRDFVHIAAQAKQQGCPAPFWFMGYSLGGQLALWGIKEAQSFRELDGLNSQDIAGGAVICPNLDGHRSLIYLEQAILGRYLEQSIAKNLKKLLRELHTHHPEEIELERLNSVRTIRDFDAQFVIPRLGFTTTRDYYQASSPLPFLPYLEKPTLILYAIDDPLFERSLIPELQQIAQKNPQINLILTEQGGHVGYLSSRSCQKAYGDRDPWWAWNRILDWLNRD
jgi:predicted alpha/beta-fold hydrolase